MNKVSSLYPGDTWELAWVLKAKKDGSLIDLTGALASLTLRLPDGTLVLQVTSQEPDLAITAPAGRIDLVLYTDQRALQPGTYTYRIRVRFANGRARTIGRAPFVILEG